MNRNTRKTGPKASEGRLPRGAAPDIAQTTPERPSIPDVEQIVKLKTDYRTLRRAARDVVKAYVDGNLAAAIRRLDVLTREDSDG